MYHKRGACTPLLFEEVTVVIENLNCHKSLNCGSCSSGVVFLFSRSKLLNPCLNWPFCFKAKFAAFMVSALFTVNVCRFDETDAGA